MSKNTKRFVNKYLNKYKKLENDFEILRSKAKKNEVYYEHTISDVV